MKEMTCANCRFLHEIEKDVWVCRRYPPQLFNNKGSLLCVYPMISNIREWWCGEYKPPFSEGSH